MYTILNNKGKAAIISSQGVLFRGSSEAAIRKGLYDEDARLFHRYLKRSLAPPSAHASSVSQREKEDNEIIKEFNLESGSKIGELLNLLREEQLNKKIKNKKQAISFLKKYI